MFSQDNPAYAYRKRQPCSLSLDAMRPCQHQKLRAQNRAAQRACRDRKLQYILGLEQKIKDTEQRLGTLRGENSELIQELCKIREQNSSFRDALNVTKGIRNSKGVAGGYKAKNDLRGSAIQDASPSPSNTSSFPDSDTRFSCESGSSNSTPGCAGAQEPLQELLSSIWTLIHLFPDVSRGNVSARVVLDSLVARVEDQWSGR